MKFVCNTDHQVMEFVETQYSADGGSMAVTFKCEACGRTISMVTNTGETQLVRSLGVTIGHEALNAQPEPMSMIRDALAGGTPPAAAPGGPQPVWSEAALKRLAAAPSFVQGMVRRLYTDYASQKGYAEITPAVMTEAREALGMTGM